MSDTTVTKNGNIIVVKSTATMTTTINTPGPKGSDGITQNISHLVTTSSFNAFTASYNTGSFTGNLIGTSSWTDRINYNSGLSSNVARVALLAAVNDNSNNGRIFSDALNKFTYNVSTQILSVTASSAISSSYSISSSYVTSASYALTASYASTYVTNITNQLNVTSSYVSSSNVDGPYGFNSIATASYAVTASYALNAVIGSITFKIQDIDSADTSSFAIDENTDVVFVDTGTNSVQLNLPVGANTVKTLIIKDKTGHGASHPIILNSTGEGGIIDWNFGSVHLIRNSSTWYITAKY